MPTNVTPEYKAAEAAYRAASDPRERLESLKEMHRTIPKHKGTEHVRADIKTRIKELTEQLASGRSGGAARTGPQTVIRPEGAAQIALAGPPNAGKSALHARLTGSHTEVGPYPFATHWPHPGMLPVHDVALQLIDLPSSSPEHPIPWIGDALRPADAVLLVVDLSKPGCVADTEAALAVLGERHVELVGQWPVDGFTAGDDPFRIRLPALLVAAKADLVDDPADELDVLEELLGLDWPTTTVSVENGAGLDELGAWLFDHLGIVRVYTKTPGSEPDMTRPFTVRTGDTVMDVATLVHKEIAAGFKYARIWGATTYAGQQVGREHKVTDGDIVEIHV